MEDVWHIKWVFGAVLGAYLVIQVFAFRRLKGDQKRRSSIVMTIMLTLMGASDAIRAIFFFENRVASRAGMGIVAGAAIVASIFLGTMFGESLNEAANSQGDTESSVQSLKLN